MINIRLFLISALLAVVLAPRAGFAQIDLDLELNHEIYLQYETIWAKVKMRNNSGHALAFGENPGLQGKLGFVISDPSEESPTCLAPKYNPLFGKVIAPGATEELVVPLSRMYRMRKPGRYRVKAMLKHSQLPEAYLSEEVCCHITKGVVTWEHEVGVPSYMGGAGKEPEKILTRSYKILTFHDGYERVYALVVDDKKLVHSVCRFGFDVGREMPQTEIDNLSNLHILLSSGPRVFSYYKYDINGNLEHKEVLLDYRDVRPRLVRDPEDGKVMVVGGVKAKENIDYVEVEGRPVLTEEALPFHNLPNQPMEEANAEE